MDDTELEVIQALADQSGVSLVTVEHDLERDLGFDSLDRWEAAILMEESIGVRPSDDDVEGWKTVQDIVDTVRKIRGQG